MSKEPPRDQWVSYRGHKVPHNPDPRRARNAMWFIALAFAALVGCTVWLSSGEPPSGPQEPLLSETPLR